MNNSIRNIIKEIRNEFCCYEWSDDCLIDQNIGEDNFIYEVEELYESEETFVAKIIDGEIIPYIELCFESNEIDFFGAQVCLVYTDQNYNIRSFYIKNLSEWGTRNE